MGFLHPTIRAKEALLLTSTGSGFVPCKLNTGLKFLYDDLRYLVQISLLRLPVFCFGITPLPSPLPSSDKHERVCYLAGRYLKSRNLNAHHLSEFF